MTKITALLLASGVWAANWVVLVNSSPAWYDYRHTTDVLLMYQAVKSLGINDSNIILMNAGTSPCDARNPWPGRQHADDYRNVYAGVQVDYRGQEVNPKEVLRVLTGRVDRATANNKRLQSDSESNILLFFVGHGTLQGTLKFGDSADITAGDLATAIEDMYIAGRYKNMLLIAETCHAETLLARVRSPNVVTLASSAWDKDSYALGRDRISGVGLADEFSVATAARFGHHKPHHQGESPMADWPQLGQIGQKQPQLNQTLREFVDAYALDGLRSDPVARFDLHPQGSQLQVIEFVAGVGGPEFVTWG